MRWVRTYWVPATLIAALAWFALSRHHAASLAEARLKVAQRIQSVNEELGANLQKAAAVADAARALAAARGHAVTAISAAESAAAEVEIKDAVAELEAIDKELAETGAVDRAASRAYEDMLKQGQLK